VADQDPDRAKGEVRMQRLAAEDGAQRMNASTAPPADIVGTWRLLSMTYRDEATGEAADLWGRDPTGLLTYTPGGRMSATIVAASRSVSTEHADQAPSEEQAALFRGLIAYAGTYARTDAGVVHHVEISSDPTLTGTDQSRAVRLEGERLVVTGPPIQTVSDPRPRVLTLVWERVE
jgi:hypothetical protein